MLLKRTLLRAIKGVFDDLSANVKSTFAKSSKPRQFEKDRELGYILMLIIIIIMHNGSHTDDAIIAQTLNRVTKLLFK